MKITRRCAAFTLSAVLLFSAFPISANAADIDSSPSGAVTDEFLTGDIDGDGKLSLMDVLAVQKHLAKVHILTSEQIAAAGFSDDGTVTVQDVTTMQKRLAAVDLAPGEGQEETLPEVTDIKLDKLGASIYAGSKITLAATVTPVEAGSQAVAFSSSNEKVATVNGNGLVTALSPGKAAITAKAGDKAAVCEITVMAKSSITFSGFQKMPENKVAVDKTFPLKGIVKSNYPLTSVCVRISGTKMTKTVKLDKSKNVKSYDINPAFDDLIYFSRAGIGKQTLEVLAADTVQTKAKVVFSYNYTVTANTSSKNLKEILYKNKTYLVPKGYSTAYLYDQRDYGKFNQGGTNVGCSATAEAIGASILYGKKISPSSSQIIWTGAGAGWGLASRRYYNCSVSSKLSRAYSELINGKPSLINTLSSSDHWVTVIGVAAAAKKGSLSSGDILIANPWGGTVTTLKEYLSSTGRYIPDSYSMRCY